MVILDSTCLLLLFHPEASAPLDKSTGQPVVQCKERIEFLLQTLNNTRTAVIVPTPVLSEVLVGVGIQRQAEILGDIVRSSAMRIEAFDQRAAVEVAMLTDADLQSGKALTKDQTIAKVKYDRQIVAIGKVNGVTVIYTDDGNLAKRAKHNGMSSISLAELPLPPIARQGTLPLVESNKAEGDE